MTPGKVQLMGAALLATATGTIVGNAASDAPMFPTATSSLPDADALHSIAGVKHPVSVIETDFESIGWWTEKMSIPGSDAFITFKRKPAMKFRCGDNMITIPDWGIEIQWANFSDEIVRQRVVRQYRMLDDKAVRRVLSEDERRWWKNLLEDSDYGDYCQRIAPEFSEVGKRIRTEKDGIVVQWSGGDREFLSGNLAEQLAIVDDGENFVARVKFINHRLYSISNVIPRGLSKPVTFEDLFGEA